MDKNPLTDPASLISYRLANGAMPGARSQPARAAQGSAPRPRAGPGSAAVALVAFALLFVAVALCAFVAVALFALVRF